MTRRIAGALAFVGTLTAVVTGVVADEKLTPSWITANPDRKQIRMDVVAGWNPNNGALNFNGYYKGSMTVVVPVGWTVSIKFTNHDGMLPHSLLITKPYKQEEMPDVAGVAQVAISRAYTINPEQGLPPNGGDTLDFKTSTPGDFDFLCGVAAHATGGMWTKFRVDDQATEPYMIIASGAEEGRK